MLSKKINAHRGGVWSVAFSPDGTKIVSGSDDKAIKVWDAVDFGSHVESEWETFDKTKTICLMDVCVVDTVETWWRNKISGEEQSLKPSGGKRLPWNPRRSKSGIMVRHALKIAPFLAKTDPCWQASWRC
jgi:WD40 repeat protein